MNLESRPLNENKRASFNNVILKNICEKRNVEVCFEKNGGRKEGAVLAKRAKILSWTFIDYFNSLIKDIFLPQGYPSSVSSDYLEYQLWDTCQAFCSSISGTLSMCAVMQGVGVGSDTATPVSAAITWIMKDGTGMIGSIIFAWSKGSQLDCDSKQWRLFADVLNDAALCVELYIPYAIEYSMILLCCSTAMKALVGVAGSATRAALTCHQAIQGNMADVSAKDGSQEIFVNLCAYVFGIFLLKNVTETHHIWAVMCTFIILHLVSNYKAVCSLKINVYNGERFRLSMRSFLVTSDVPTVEQVNRNEAVVLGCGIRDRKIFGYDIFFGVPLENTILGQSINNEDLSFLVTMFQSKNYIIVPDVRKKKILVSFRTQCADTDVLKGYFHAVLVSAALGLSKHNTLPFLTRKRQNSPITRLEKVMKKLGSDKKSDIHCSQALPVGALLSCEEIVEREFALFCRLSSEKGWKLEKHLILVGDWKSVWRYKKETIFATEMLDDTVTNPKKRVTYNVPPQKYTDKKRKSSTLTRNTKQYLNFTPIF